ncbi:hypothetical protein [Paenibacillus elgii]|uniref:hypothetical protein n=1 Tax=Paenibacillus elgii TaxID=189691 RepID=UPI00203E63E7|nr:hypothetical protein [Paenibacillus elgii]MCM3267849.1 hypothetical protein [Paenibacillus elgii]
MNKRKYLLFSLLGLVIVSGLMISSLTFDEIGKIGSQSGDTNEKEKIKKEFLYSLNIGEHLSEEEIQQLSGEYDFKTNDYYIEAIYKNEPSVIYVYYKNQNGDFKLGGVLGEGQGKSPEELSNDHIFSSYIKGT